MKITQAMVHHIAKLARLELSDEELQTFTGQLDSILEYVAQLNELDLLDVEGTTLAVPMDCPQREDAVKPSMQSDTILRQAPQRQDSFFSVPQIIE